jgi:hypothetical protein
MAGCSIFAIALAFDHRALALADSRAAKLQGEN